MLRVVLPGIAIPPINALPVVIAIGIIYEVVAAIDINVIVSSPPSSIPAATASPSCSHRHTNAK
jgi:hypothetical protein